MKCRQHALPRVVDGGYLIRRQIFREYGYDPGLFVYRGQDEVRLADRAPDVHLYGLVTERLGAELFEDLREAPPGANVDLVEPGPFRDVSRLPVERLSTTATSSSLSNRCSATYDPMKPPPVRRTHTSGALTQPGR